MERSFPFNTYYLCVCSLYIFICLGEETEKEKVRGEQGKKKGKRTGCGLQVSQAASLSCCKAHPPSVFVLKAFLITNKTGM